MERPLTEHIRPRDEEPMTLKEYEKVGGYQSVRKALKMSSKNVQQEVKKANLRGRGGAGFNTGMKWSFVPLDDETTKPHYLCCNADEMEPGSFKDRVLMEGNPHLLIEGIICGAWAIQASAAYIFLRWAYKRSDRRLRKAIAEAYDAGYLGKNILGSGFDLDIYMHNSAGRYICGEETGLLNATEGVRPTARSKPPYPPVSGLFGRPTVVNNVETWCNVPYIINHGPDAYQKLSLSSDGGTKIYGAAGRVKKPGWWELPMGTPIREIIEKHAGGMQDGYELVSIIPGGASTDFILEKDLDIPMDFDSLSKVGSRMGTATILAVDQTVCPVALIASLEKFFAQESCGWCTPCREGLPWTARMLYAIEAGNGRMEDLDQLNKLCDMMDTGHTVCALAPGAVEPLRSGLKLFRDVFERHIKEQRCPWGK
ncbi:MAG: NADH-quinone oxidoreductase subunit NuoF [Candidatus Zixiibacteriota bacterium]|jgi:NADH-quinone oxidoreductase subunit F